MSLIAQPAHVLAAMLRRRELSSRELVQAFLDRIEAVEDRVQAYVTVAPERALAEASSLDDRRARGETLHPLAGIPIAIKDNMCTRGLLTTCSSRILANFVPPYDATVVTRLRETGAVILGKTNLDEFAMGSSTENSGLHPTSNPWDLSRVPGGSSGGSAAAVAADETVWATGSDTGGSIRQPASFCGVVGLKPTYGRVSRYGLVAFASSLDQIGPIARDVEDAALLLGVLAGPDPLDATSIHHPVPDYVSEMRQPVRGLRIGVPGEYFIPGLDPSVEKPVRDAIALLESRGCEVVEVSLPHTDYAIAAYYVLCTAEASSNLARYDGVAYGPRVEGENIVEMYTNTRTAGFGDEVKRRIVLGTYVLSSGFYDAYYLKAQKVRTLIRRDFEAAFGKCDLIATPVAPGTCYPKGSLISDPLEMYLTDVFTVPVSLAGLPGISVPCGFTGEGLPVGLQLVGRLLEEGTVLRVAHAFEEAAGLRDRKPALAGKGAA